MFAGADERRKKKKREGKEGRERGRGRGETEGLMDGELGIIQLPTPFGQNRTIFLDSCYTCSTKDTAVLRSEADSSTLYYP